MLASARLLDSTAFDGVISARRTLPCTWMLVFSPLILSAWVPETCRSPFGNTLSTVTLICATIWPARAVAPALSDECARPRLAAPSTTFEPEDGLPTESAPWNELFLLALFSAELEACAFS